MNSFAYCINCPRYNISRYLLKLFLKISQKKIKDLLDETSILFHLKTSPYWQLYVVGEIKIQFGICSDQIDCTRWRYIILS